MKKTLKFHIYFVGDTIFNTKYMFLATDQQNIFVVFFLFKFEAEIVEVKFLTRSIFKGAKSANILAPKFWPKRQISLPVKLLTFWGYQCSWTITSANSMWVHSFNLNTPSPDSLQGLITYFA